MQTQIVAGATHIRASIQSRAIMMAQHLLATMATTTSFGTWMPGDLRGYVDDGIILPSNPRLLNHATSLMSKAPVLFTAAQQRVLFDALVDAAAQFKYRLICASVESWHLHWLIDHGFDDVPTMMGRLKNALRQALAIGRIWTAGYDSRYCFTDEQVEARSAYIMRHAGHRPLPTAPRIR